MVKPLTHLKMKYNSRMDEGTEQKSFGKRLGHGILVSLLTVRFLFLSIIDWAVDTIGLAVREKDLFLGAALFLIGVFSFEVGRYCDGNAGDYLSCTRPAVYYYYDTFDIALIVLGAALVIAWFVKERMKVRG